MKFLPGATLSEPVGNMCSTSTARMKRIGLLPLLLILGLLFRGNSPGEGLELNGYLLNQFTMGITKESGESSYLQLKSKFQLQFSRKFSSIADFSAKLYIENFFIDETIDENNLILGNPANSSALDKFFAIPSENTPLIGIKEAFVNLYLDRLYISLGKKIIRWGTGDIFSPNNKISPR